MDDAGLWSSVRVILARELNADIDSLDDSKLLREELKIDSIVALNLLFALEKELSLTVTEEQVVSLDTVGDLRRLVTRLSAAS